jgi:DNA invertase Pin-like site-specific DNA recombinase
VNATILRAAIYCRKSSEEGLEQDFNSLDAQREACAAFIASQRHQGWRLLPQRFEDGGFSGGTLERPALQRLLAAIRARHLDIVVVYKVDRLTRSLADFAKLVEVFDARSVSFVSVTQQFNTTSSMGRLTLNVLLSFAQFEREVTGERIRDKIAASKRKGMWMGGTVPLGYRVEERRLQVVASEADTVRRLFALYRREGTVQALAAAAAQEGLTTRTGKPFFPGHLYQLLQNPLYRGEIRHHAIVYPGLHEAIIEPATWQAVQDQLAAHRVRRRERRGMQHPSLLAGKLVGADGNAFTPSHAVKAGRRYRYYIERLPQAEAGTKRRRHQRLAAAEIEALVTATVIARLRSTPDLLAAARVETPSSEAARALTERAATLAENLTTGAEPCARWQALLQRVRLGPESVQIELDINALRSALALPPVAAGEAPHHTIEVAAHLRRRGVEVKFIIEGPATARASRPDPSLIRTIVRAHDWWRRWCAGQGDTLTSIARAEGVTDRFVARVVALAFLAPDLTTAILDGQQSPALSTDDLFKQWLLPPGWDEQRRLLG